MVELSVYRRGLDRALEARRAAVGRAGREAAGLAVCRGGISDAEEAQRVAQTVAQTIQRRVHEALSRVVDRCLAAVFEEPYTFRIRFDRKRGRTEAVPEFVREGVVLDDPLNEVGGGVCDVAALALRIGCLLLRRPPARRMLMLDEPFRNVRGERNRARTRAMLEGLASEMGFQVLMSTDIPEYRLGTVVEVGVE